MRHIQERQRSTEIGSHIPASVKYLRYVSRPSNRPQSNMLKMFVRKLRGEHVETSDRERETILVCAHFSRRRNTLFI